MKMVVTQERLRLAVETACAAQERCPSYRIGQHVVNTLLTGTALDGPDFDSGSRYHSSQLFYCDDSEFWDVVFDFIAIGEYTKA